MVQAKWLAILGVLLAVILYVVILGRKSRFLFVRNSRLWLFENGLRTAGYLVPAVLSTAFAVLFWIFDRNLIQEFDSVRYRWFLRTLYSIPFVTMALGIFADPGYVTPQNHATLVAQYPYDRILYVPFKECRTCKLTRPARSKHCSLCDRCVALADHHCFWLGKCIGQGNFPYFYLFLISNTLLMFYATWVLGRLLMRPAADVWRDGHRWFGFLYTLFRSSDKARITLCLLLFPALMMFLGGVFTWEMLSQVYMGTTSNEVEKWQEVEDLFSEGSLYTYKFEASLAHPPTILLQQLRPDDPTDLTVRYNRQLNEHELALVSEYNGRMVQVKSFDDIHNIYDHGFWNNLRLNLGLNSEL